MAWITKDDVAALLHQDLADDAFIDGDIDHAQALAEIEVGEQSAPNTRLKAVLAQIVARMWQSGESARVNPAGLSQQQTGPFAMQDPRGGTAGLGLTNREKALLRKAVGKSDLWVQPTSRGDRLEMGPVDDDELVDGLDPIEQLAGAQADMPRPQP